MRVVYAQECVEISNVQRWAAHVQYGEPEQVLNWVTNSGEETAWNNRKPENMILQVHHQMEQPLLQHHNAWLHKDAKTNAKIWQIGFTPCDQKPHSHDLGPLHFHLFPKMK